MSNNKKNNNKYGAFELKKYYKKFEFRGLMIAIMLHLVIIFAYVYAKIIDLNKSEMWHSGGCGVILFDFEPPPSIIKDTPYLLEKISMTYPSTSRDKTVYEPQPIASKDAEILTIRSQDELNTIKTYLDDINIEYFNMIFYNSEKNEDGILKAKDCIKVEDRKCYKQSEVDKPPVPLNLNSVRESIIYPDSAIIKCIEGKVSVKFLVNRDGKVTIVSVITGPEIFHNEVSRKVRNLKFKSAIRDGMNVGCWVNIPFDFKLKN